MGAVLHHGDLVGPGILISSALQRQNITSLKAALKNYRIPMKNISENIITKTLEGLSVYLYKHGGSFRYSSYFNL